MKCLHCGANIPDDQVICPECGAEVQIVPDYNPLDDVLTREVKGSVEGATRQIRSGDIRRYNNRTIILVIISYLLTKFTKAITTAPAAGNRNSRTSNIPGISYHSLHSFKALTVSSTI